MIENQNLIKSFNEIFNKAPTDGFISFGRLEICGNHTDHNNGKCLVATCNLPIKASCCKEEDGTIEIVSKGFDKFSFNINDLNKVEEEKGKTISIAKGVCYFLKQFGFKIGGFKAYIESEVLPGAGVSSSAAIEGLFVEILSFYYNEDRVSKIQKAMICQKSENEFFGKPCGLLDQIGSCFGGINYVDFKNLNKVKVKTIDYPFDSEIYLINTGGSHEGLTDLYAAIPHDMKEAARKVGGKECLRRLSLKKFLTHYKNASEPLTDLELSRSLHFYYENIRVKKAFKACKKKDKIEFLNCVRESGFSSMNLLKNVMVEGDYENSPKKAMDLFNENLKESACKIHGGGFKGTVICFVEKNEKSIFEEKIKKIFGEVNIINVSISAVGASHFCLIQ